MPLRMSEAEFAALKARTHAPNDDNTQDPNIMEHAAAAGFLAVVLFWITQRLVKLALWASAVLAVAYAYLAVNPLCAVGVAMLALAIAMMICPAESVPGRINAALTSAWWMLFAVFTAGAALHRLGRRHLGGSGIFASTARALLAAFVLTMLAAYGASIRAHGEPRHVSCGEVTDYPERHPHSHCFDDYKRPGESLLHAVKRFKRETKYDELIPCVTVRADPKRYPGSHCARGGR
jgi:hypothetical protein